MEKYRVYLETTASMSVEVEADSMEEAVEYALDEHGGTSSCHQEPFELGDWDVPKDNWAVVRLDE